MWLFTRYGFFSVVCVASNSINLNALQIRARFREHLVNLKKRFKFLDYPIIKTTDSDYAYRMIVGHDVWDEVAIQLSHEINYSNFKNEVLSTMINDHDYYRWLNAVWQTGASLQTPQPYSQTTAESKAGKPTRHTRRK